MPPVFKGVRRFPTLGPCRPPRRPASNRAAHVGAAPVREPRPVAPAGCFELTQRKACWALSSRCRISAAPPAGRYRVERRGGKTARLPRAFIRCGPVLAKLALHQQAARLAPAGTGHDLFLFRLALPSCPLVGRRWRDVDARKSVPVQSLSGQSCVAPAGTTTHRTTGRVLRVTLRRFPGRTSHRRYEQRRPVSGVGTTLQASTKIEPAVAPLTFRRLRPIALLRGSLRHPDEGCAHPAGRRRRLDLFP